MKTTITTLLTAICVSGLLLSAAAQPDNNAAATTDRSTQSATRADAGAAPPDAAQAQPAQDQGAMNGQDATAAQTETAPAENRPITSTVIVPRGNAPEAIASAFAPPAHAIGTNQNDLDMNFNNARLDMVLNYLSDAAGFIVVQEVPVNGYVTIKGSHITKDQAVDLLNSTLNRNNYAAIQDANVLTIVNKSDAKMSRIPVKMGNNPTNIPNTDEIATWIIPIRFVEARQLVSDLSLFVSPQATLVANEAGNSIVITDTQANIRHLVQIIQLVDGSAESETEIKVFVLKHASPVDVANELSSIFPSSSGSGSQSPFAFAGGGGGRGAGAAGSAAAAPGAPAVPANPMAPADWNPRFVNGRTVRAFEFVQGQRRRYMLISKWAEYMKDLDMFIGAPTADVGANSQTGHPCVVVQYKFDVPAQGGGGGGRGGAPPQPPLDLKPQPICATIIGNLYNDDKILSVAHQYQVNTDIHLKHPSL